MSICETANGDLRLVDRFETNVIKTDVWAEGEQSMAKAELASEDSRSSQPGCKRMLGRFDRDDARKYGFRAPDGI